MFGNFSRFLWHITDKISEIYERLNQWAVKEIVRRIIKTGEINKSSVNQIYKMREAGMTMTAIQKEVTKHSGLSEKEVKKAFEDAAIESSKEDEKLYRKAGIKSDNVLQSEKMKNVLETASLQTNSELKNITRTMANQSERIFVEALDGAYMKVQSGMTGYEQAIAEAVKEVSKNGLYIQYPSGHSSTVETAVRRALMTGLNQGTIKMKIEQIKSMGNDLLVTSRHLGARTGGKYPYEDHSKWQGKVFSISGTSDKYPSFKEECGWGKGGGIGGWNCRHHVYGFVEGVSRLPEPVDTEENKRIEELNKKQRRMETAIRSKKRELIGLQEAMDISSDDKLKFELQQQYDKSAYELRGMNNGYKEFCKKNELKTWNERLKIVDFERQQSYEARLGADRYKCESKLSIKRQELTENERGAVIRYKSPDAYSLNDKLRRGAVTELTELEKNWIEGLDSALNKLPRYKGNLNRSVYFENNEDARAMYEEFVVGEKYVPSQYLSATKQGVYNDEANVQIYIENAANGRDLEKVTTMESEVLYPRGAKFKVIYKTEKDGQYWILLEEAE